MAGKKQRTKVVSKGIHSSIKKSLVTATRAARSPTIKFQFKIDAWRRELNPWLTVANPSKNATNRPFIRVRANDYWGKPVYKAEDAE